METTQLEIQGMKCGACVSHVTKALQSVVGVQSADVDLASRNATVQHDDDVERTKLIGAVTEAGYQAHRVGNTDARV